MRSIRAPARFLEGTGAMVLGATLLPLAVPAIELAGGSARCMLASTHLAPR